MHLWTESSLILWNPVFFQTCDCGDSTLCSSERHREGAGHLEEWNWGELERAPLWLHWGGIEPDTQRHGWEYGRFLHSLHKPTSFEKHEKSSSWSVRKNRQTIQSYTTDIATIPRTSANKEALLHLFSAFSILASSNNRLFTASCCIGLWTCRRALWHEMNAGI